MMRSILLSLIGAVTAGMMPAFAQDDSEFGRLFNAPGAEETFIYCTACHSEMIVAQQGKTRENWNELFEWMIEEQGMDEIPEPDRTIVLDYLAKHYNIDRPNFPRSR